MTATGTRGARATTPIRLAWQAGRVAAGVVSLLVVGAMPVLALLANTDSVDASLEHALARGVPPLAAAEAVGWAALAGVLLAGYLHWRASLPGAASGSRAWAWVVLGLSAWVGLGAAQTVTAQTIGTPTVLLRAGYLVLPAALGTVWVLVATRYRPLWLPVWSLPSYRWIAGAITVAFTGYYLWTSNLIQMPAPEDLPPPGTPGFVKFDQFYGQLAIWPDVEFYSPHLKLFAAVSLGDLLVIPTLAALIALAWTSQLLAFRHQRHASTGARGGGLASLGAAGLSGCCCCAPALYPALALLLGTTSAGSVSVWLTGSSSPLAALTQVGMITLLLATLARQQRRRHLGLATPARPPLTPRRSQDSPPQRDTEGTSTTSTRNR